MTVWKDRGMSASAIRTKEAAYSEAVHQQAAFGEPLDSALKNDAFDVGTDLSQLLRAEGVVDALDVLLDCNCSVFFQHACDTLRHYERSFLNALIGPSSSSAEAK